MALTATAPPEILLKLSELLKEPYIVESSINREKSHFVWNECLTKDQPDPRAEAIILDFAMLYSIYRFCG